MTPARPLAELLAEYHTGLEAEVQLLSELQRLATAQHDAGHAPDLQRVGALAVERDRVMTALVELETQLKPLRQTLAAHPSDIAALPGYAQTKTLHHQAEALVREIVAGDRQTVAALEQVESTRRLAHELIARGQQSLHAYRRVLLPESLPAALFNRRS